jgi:hypothetical protein
VGYFNCSGSKEAYYLSMANRPRPANRASVYRGVSRSNNAKLPWRAALGYRGGRYYLGNHATEREAALAYNEAALRIIGEHAVINEITDDQLPISS